MTFTREDRYLVLKRKDIAAALDELEQGIFFSYVLKIYRRRRLAGKEAPIECVVVESDWPEYESTWEAIQKRMEGE